MIATFSVISAFVLASTVACGAYADFEIELDPVAPAYVTMSCLEGFIDKCVIHGDGAAWRQISWKDTQTGYYVVPMAVNDGLKFNCEALNLSIAPHTVQSVTFVTRNALKK